MIKRMTQLERGAPELVDTLVHISVETVLLAVSGLALPSFYFARNSIRSVRRNLVA